MCWKNHKTTNVTTPESHKRIIFFYKIKKSNKPIISQLLCVNPAEIKVH